MNGLPGPLINVRPAEETDLPLMSSWQCAYVPEGLFPRLGEAFVRRWHKTFLDTPRGIALIAEAGAPDAVIPLGFLIGSTDQVRDVNETLHGRRTGLILSALAALACRPRLWVPFVRTRGRTYLQRIAFPREDRGLQERTPDRNLPGGRVTAVIQPLPWLLRPEVPVPAACWSATSSFWPAMPALPRAELVAAAGAGGAGPFYERLGWTAIEEHLSRDDSRVPDLPLRAGRRARVMTGGRIEAARRTAFRQAGTLMLRAQNTDCTAAATGTTAESTCRFIGPDFLRSSPQEQR
ncbi:MULTISPECIES: hypothetical protein [Micrococcaceae]|jgi:hypothetical protein|uniref:N-acetyltransferase domain-containing protein n=3 Tax=Micrococcaceae TaxID=1268 RepID=Q6SK84_PAEAU|nr:MULTISPECIES: hypothetical protein [Micrococcaceae]AAS20088.1 hypothetical protein [Paenarthrobacter aurescens]ABM10489.1 hypothetical protein AAur_pTC10175 [Paenarthrobacter aurescens TC1]SDQ03269.1 hypothetical protein SAMN04489742_0054 [Arthrobacter crystallopoietes]